MVDKNGKEVNVGDKIVPADGNGMMLLIVSKFFVDSLKEDCLFGQQVEDPMSFSPLTQEVLSKYWVLYEGE